MAEDIPDRGEHLSRMTVGDLFLDCPRYNGHASAMDALHAKLPILTIKGNRFCTRVGESLARNSGLAELVAKDLKEYEKKAIALGLEPARLLKFRKAIQSHADHTLSPGSHAHRLEEAIDRILTMKVPASNFLEKPLPREVGMRERKKNDTLSDLLSSWLVRMTNPIGRPTNLCSVKSAGVEVSYSFSRTSVLRLENLCFTSRSPKKRSRIFNLARL